MPNTSGSPTQIASSVDTVAELEGTPADQFKNGDQGFVRSELLTPHGPLYMLIRGAGLPPLPPVNGVTFLAVFQQPTDRWVSTSLLNGIGPFSRTFYCDPQTPVPSADQDGSVGRPFALIQDGLNALQNLGPPVPGGLGTLILTAGEYLEDIQIPPGINSFDKITIVGQGEDATILGTGTTSCFVWVPMTGTTPATRWEIYGCTLRGNSVSPAVFMDGSSIPGDPVMPGIQPFFPPDFPVNPGTVGFQFKSCWVQGVRLIRTGVVLFEDCGLAFAPSSIPTAMPIIFQQNVLLTVYDATLISGVVEVHHDNPAVARFASIGLFASKISQSGTPTSMLVDGLAACLIDEGSELDCDLTWNPTIASGQTGFMIIRGGISLGPTGNFGLTCNFPDDGPAPPGSVVPTLDAAGARILGPVNLFKPVSTGASNADRGRCVLRGAVLGQPPTFLGPPPNPLTFVGWVVVDLTGATFNQSDLIADPNYGLPNATWVLRSTVTYPDGSYGPFPGPAVVVPINPQFPTGTVYAATSSASTTAPVLVGGKTPLQFSVLDPGVPGFVAGDIVLSLSD